MSACAGKVPYERPEAARAALDAIQKRRRSIRDRASKPLRAYACECGKWHIDVDVRRAKR